LRTLPERDVAALLSVTGELAALDDARPFPPHLLGRLGEVVGGANVAYNELDRARERSVFYASSVDDASATEAVTDEEQREFFRLVLEHPVCGRRKATQDWTSVLKVSDFSSLRQFQRTEIWAELYRDNNVNYWIDVGLEPTGARTRMFLFTRNRRDFDERDRLMLELLQPYLQRRYDDVMRAADAADALATLEEGGTDSLHDIVLCTTGGVIEFASRRSRRLLETYFRSDNGHLPEALHAALARSGSLVVEREQRRLTIRTGQAAGMLVLLLGEEDLRLDQLTSRQLEILRHVASGATDAEVGAALDIAPATVKKHLEQIYDRLGVHTRTAAAALLSPPSN
jgi:DNA-binding NarL/FixJ family response regulator